MTDRGPKMSTNGGRREIYDFQLNHQPDGWEWSRMAVDYLNYSEM